MTESPEDFRQWTTDSPLWDKLKPLVREKRHQPTFAENTLWQQLRGRQLNNLKFRRQHPVEQFIVDFFCTETRLVIEVDGEIHQYTIEEDAIRQEFLESRNLRVLRVTNDEVLNSIGAVLKTIMACSFPTPNSADRL